MEFLKNSKIWVGFPFIRSTAIDFQVLELELGRDYIIVLDVTLIDEVSCHTLLRSRNGDWSGF